MSLLDDIQASAIDENSNVPSLLRKCLLLAARLSHNELEQWATWELLGYPGIEKLPPYRIILVNSYGSFQGPYRSGSSLQISVNVLPEHIREQFRCAYLGQGISAYIELLNTDASDSLIEEWPLYLAVKASSLYGEMQCYKAWKDIPRSAVAKVIDSVKTRILNFSIDVSRESPKAGDTPIGSKPPITQERLTQMFINNISGNVGNIASGSHGFSQNSNQIDSKGNWGNLAETLKSFGISEGDLISSKTEIEAIQNLSSETEKKSAALTWMGKMMGKIATGATGVGIEAAASGVAKAIAAYIGIPL